MKRRFIAVEDVLNIFDNNRLWYYIPNFRGYEISNDYYIRSMKHYRKYPYGILIQPVKREPYGSSTDPLYELSDDNNVRQRIRLSQLMYLAQANNFNVYGYPRCTIISNPESRNVFVKNKEGIYTKVYNGPRAGGGRNPQKRVLDDKKVTYAKFTIVQDGTEMPFMEYQQPKLRVPVVSIDGSEYYGRKDCSVTCNINNTEEFYNNGREDN